VKKEGERDIEGGGMKLDQLLHLHKVDKVQMFPPLTCTGAKSLGFQVPSSSPVRTSRVLIMPL